MPQQEPIWKDGRVLFSFLIPHFSPFLFSPLLLSPLLPSPLLPFPFLSFISFTLFFFVSKLKEISIKSVVNRAEASVDINDKKCSLHTNHFGKSLNNQIATTHNKWQLQTQGGGDNPDFLYISYAIIIFKLFTFNKILWSMHLCFLGTALGPSRIKKSDKNPCPCEVDILLNNYFYSLRYYFFNILLQ